MSTAITMTKSGRGVSGSALFTDGMSSMLDPMFVSDRSYHSAINVLNRGGKVRTRPGYNTIFQLPDGIAQGLWYFRPLSGAPYLVFAVSGTVYVSQYPFISYSALPNISFFQFATTLFAESAVQSSVTKSDGTVIATEPVRVLIMQDGGFTRAAYWDGANSGHLDPSAQGVIEPVLDTASGGEYNGVPTYSVAKTNVLYGGNGFLVAPRVVFSAPDDPSGVTATGTAILTGDAVSGILMTNNGSGYIDAPTAYLTDPSVSTTDPKFGYSTKFQVPLGGPMVWSGDRLWVGSGNKVLASDIANPISFVENQYAADGGFFQFTEPVTALAEAPSPVNPFVAIFTDANTSAIQSSVRSRSSWKITPSFQSMIFPGVGCVSQRSVVKPLGELWWMSPFGLISFNSAAQASRDSKIVPQDTRMMVSKSNLFTDLSGAAAGTYENFILMSVPYADKYNQHTWVYDQVASSDDASASATASWAGSWTGTRPLQWATGVFNGVQRAFYISKDFDGKNRLWEAFVSSRTDNGERISCFMETKMHTSFGDERVGGLDNKKFVFGEVTMAEIRGQVDLVVDWAGQRGKYKEILTWALEADKGSLMAGVNLTSVSTYRTQSRVLRTREVVQNSNSACSSLNVESPLSDYVDFGFSLLINWTGEAALQNYRIWVDPFDEMSTGTKGGTETSPRILEGAVCP